MMGNMLPAMTSGYLQSLSILQLLKAKIHWIIQVFMMKTVGRYVHCELEIYDTWPISEPPNLDWDLDWECIP